MKTQSDRTQAVANPFVVQNWASYQYNTAALLPPNATQAERDLVEASDFSDIFQQSVASLQQLRTEPSAQVLKHRLWESGLEDVNRWVKDPKQALEFGQYWRSLLGTPKSVYMALDWLGIRQAKLHEGELGKRFYEVRLELNTKSDRYLQATKLTQYCLPVRCQLKRVYNGQARGPLVLGDQKQGLMSKTLLQAEPGITIDGFGDIRFSFIQTYDPCYRLKLQAGHSEYRHQGIGHYGNAFHLLGEDLLGARHGLHQYQATTITQSVIHSINFSQAQLESQQSEWYLRSTAALHNPTAAIIAITKTYQAHLQGLNKDYLIINMRFQIDLHKASAAYFMAFNRSISSAQALHKSTRTTKLTTQQQTDVQAFTSIQQQQHLPYQRTQLPLHFSHFEDLLCPAR